MPEARRPTGGRVPLTVAVSVVFVGALVLSSVQLATRIPATLAIAGPASAPGLVRTGLGKLLSPRQSFSPLAPGFLERVLGVDGSALLGAPGGPGGDGSSMGNVPRRRPGPIGQAAPPTTTTTAGLVGSIGPAPVPQFSDLAVSMETDRASVAPGETIRYAVVVTNIGTAEFVGQLRVDAHHPFGTTDATSPCGEAPVDPNPAEPCVGVPAPVPGTPDESVHTVGFSYGGRLERGRSVEFSFRVRVNPGTPAGSEIRNHAHLDVAGDGEAATTSNTTTVRVR